MKEKLVNDALETFRQNLEEIKSKKTKEYLDRYTVFEVSKEDLKYLSDKTFEDEVNNIIRSKNDMYKDFDIFYVHGMLTIFDNRNIEEYYKGL